MNFLRRLLLLISLSALIFSSVLLLNFTASNPTGRRYSSQIPSQTSRGRDGGDAERILSIDLDVPHNHTSTIRQCVCNPQYADNPPRQNCDVCTVLSEGVSNYRVPDFFTDTYIAEAKNYAPRSDIYGSNRDQIDAFLAMAHYLQRPLWLYVAVDSQVTPEVQYLIEQTGGGVVFYFTVPGYVDPVDDGATKGVVASTLSIGVLGFAEVVSRRPRRKAPADVVEKTRQTVDTAEEFARRSKERVRIQVEIEDE